MPPVTPLHHGISVRDLASWRAAIAPLGFTLIEPGAETPRHYANVDADPIGRMIAGWLGDEIYTHYIENPATGQQIDLVQISPRSMVERASDAPLQGDTTVGITVRDPQSSYDAMRAASPSLVFSQATAEGEELHFAVDSQHMVLTTGQAFTHVHYSPEGWTTARRFYEDVLGLPLAVAGDADGERYTIPGAAAEVVFIVDPATPVAAAGSGKKYPGANHFRLFVEGIEDLEGRVAESGLGTWLFPPRGRFAQIYGPTGEFIELYDASLAPTDARTLSATTA